MYLYKSEILETTAKWGMKVSAGKKDLENLDELINARMSEGWELVTYSFMANSISAGQSAVLITFRKMK